MSIYPNAIDGFQQLPLVVDGITEVNAFSVNNLRAAILNIEQELGVAPSGVYGTVSARLDALELGGGVDLSVLEARVTILEVTVGAINTELGLNPSGTYITVENRLDAIEAASTAPLSLIADSALSLGDLLIVNSSGNVDLADSNSGITNESRVIGSSAASYLVGDVAEINSIPGRLIPARFAVPPIASNNGSPVYLSGTPGLAIVTPPAATGTVVFFLGILQGADGITTTPNILFQPSLIAVG